MISIRQLIFIINIVFFFVNPATSGNGSSSSITQCFQFLFGKKSSTSNEDSTTNVEEPSPSTDNETVYDYKKKVKERDIILYEVTDEHIGYCRMELYTAFYMENGWDNFLYAFANIRKADFDKEWSIYTKAAAEYYFDLLCVSHEMPFQPRFMDPRAYCQQYYGREEDDCLSSIEKMGCTDDDPGNVCLRQLYFNWNDEELPYLRPYRGTENMSDEDLENALSKIKLMFPEFSAANLWEHLSVDNLLRDFYRQYPDRYEIINELCDEMEKRKRHYEAISKSSRYEERRKKLNSLANEATIAYENQREEDIEDACESSYGIRIFHQTMVNELERRQNLYKVHINSYANFLLNQLEECGRNNQDFKENYFKNREQFCTSYLSENRHYYDFMYLK